MVTGQYVRVAGPPCHLRLPPILAQDGPRLSFVYLGAVDITGHAAGGGAAYREAARAADERVGRLLAAVRSRPGYAGEGWTTVVVTDITRRFPVRGLGADVAYGDGSSG